MTRILNTMNKPIVLILFLLMGHFVMPDANGCSMFKITRFGKTMVGNNEDFWNPNTRIWFEKRPNDKYGVAYVGYNDFWPQGGMNQAGLVFDGFAEDYLAINDTLGKIPPADDFLQFIMGNFATVDEVKTYLNSHNLYGMETSMLFFVDKTGRYLIAEGDSLITGEKEYYIASNFYPSQTKEEDVVIDFYQKGRKYMQNYRDTSVSYCASVMDTMHQEISWGAGTMYSTVYDLYKGTIYLYYYHDFTKAVMFNLNCELKKGNYNLEISDLFPGNNAGHKYLCDYNTISKQIDLLKDNQIVHDSLQYNRVLDTIFSGNPKLLRIFEDKFYDVGSWWMNEENYDGAIAVYTICCRLNPTSESWKILANAYLENKQYDLALLHYKKSLEINPNNADVKLQLEKIKELNNK